MELLYNRREMTILPIEFDKITTPATAEKTDGPDLLKRLKDGPEALSSEERPGWGKNVYALDTAYFLPFICVVGTSRVSFVIDR